MAWAPTILCKGLQTYTCMHNTYIEIYTYIDACIHTCMSIHTYKQPPLHYPINYTDNGKMLLGAVHKVRHAIFGQFLPPLPLSHFVTHPGTPRKYVTHLEPPDF